jgi:hypothetical protein
MNTHWIKYNGLQLRVEGKLTGIKPKCWISFEIIVNDVNIEPMLNYDTILEINRIVFEENYKTK